MKCPKCSSESMERRTECGIEIDRCTACNGIWLDMLELEGLLKRNPRELIVDDRRFAPSLEEPGPRIHCPHCTGTYLIKLNSLQRPGTILDSCTVCFGTWLDAGELARLSERGFWQSFKALFA